jgi:hypothetical protein
MNRKIRNLLILASLLLLIGLPTLSYSMDQRELSTGNSTVTRVRGFIEDVSSASVKVGGERYHILGVVPIEDTDGNPVEREMLTEGAKVRLHVNKLDNSIVKIVFIHGQMLY